MAEQKSEKRLGIAASVVWLSVKVCVIVVALTAAAGVAVLYQGF